MPVKFNVDWEKVTKKITDNLIDIGLDELGHNIALAVKENTEHEIETGVFDTVGGSTAVGLKHTGEYKDSFEIASGVKRGNTYRIEVGSTKKEAPKLEYGTEPQDNADLKDRTLIRWAQAKGINDYVTVGIATANMIRKFGTVPKPAFRRGQQLTKSKGESVKRKAIDNIELRIKRIYP